MPGRLVAALCLAWITHQGACAQPGPFFEPELNQVAPAEWMSDGGPSGDGDAYRIGEGFARGTYRVGLALGHANGPPWFGSTERHDLLLTTLQLGWMATGVVGKGHVYAGNLELVIEALGGWQFHPRDAYVAGLAPILRYHIATGSRWVPFLEAGAGFLATDIRTPDLGSDFTFHSLAGLGVTYRLTHRSAVGLEARFGHISNAGIAEPNAGVNEFGLLAGWSWFF